MKRTIGIANFTGLHTWGDLSPSSSYARDLLNTRCYDGNLYARFGHRQVTGRDAGVTAVHGLMWAEDTVTGNKEWVSIETIGGVTRPYSIHHETGVKTQIGTVVLADGDHIGSVFDEWLYVIAPGAVKPVYRHKIGDVNSWETVQDTAFVPSPDDPSITKTVAAPAVIADFVSGITFAYSTVPGQPIAHDTITEAYSSGIVTLSGIDRDEALGATGQPLVAEWTYAAPVDFSAADYGYIVVNALSDVNANTAIGQGFYPQPDPVVLTIGGAPVNLETRYYVSGDTRQCVYMFRLRGVAGVAAVQKVKIRLQYKPTRSTQSPAAQPILTIDPPRAGGTYLEAEDAAKRLWDTNLDGDGVTYGVRYADAGLTSFSGVAQASIVREQGLGYLSSSYSPRVGGRVTLAAPAPVGPFTQIQFLRLDSTGTYRVVGTVSAAPWSYRDQREEHEIAALPAAGSGVAVETQPEFSGAGVVAAVPYKGSMVWLRNNRAANISFSRIGNPLEQYSALDAYEENDLTQPVDWTMADGASDEPVGAVALSQSLVVLGKNAAYARNADFGVDAIPFRQVPGSFGVAGRFAYCRAKISGGYAAVWCDHFGNVWSVSAAPRYAGDSAVGLNELTQGIRGQVWDHLVKSQAQELGFIDLSQMRVVSQDYDQSVWLILGRKAMVLRPSDPLAKSRYWEKMEYAVTAPSISTTSESCTPFVYGAEPAAGVARADSTSAWVNAGAIFLGDDTYASVPMNVGAKSELLRVASMPPSPALGSGSTLTKIQIEVERRVTGNGTVRDDEAFLLLNGVRTGATEAALSPVPGSDMKQVYEFMAPAVTVAQLNSGAVGFEVGYTADGSAGSINPANWNVVVSPVSPVTDAVVGFGETMTTVFTVTATWIGGGVAPSVCPIQVNTTLFAEPGSSPCNVRMSHDNGVGSVVEGLVYHGGPVTFPDIATIYTHSLSGEQKESVATVAGVATKVVTIVSSVVGNALKWADVDHTVTASIFSPDPTTLFVDAIRVSACSTGGVNVGESSSSWSYASFGASPLRQFWAIQPCGVVNEIEWNSLTKEPIDGDSGKPQIPGFWEGHTIFGDRVRVSNVRVIRGYGVEVSLTADTDETISSETVATTKVYGRFSTSMRGHWINLRVSVPVGIEIRQYTFEVTSLGHGYTR